MLGFLSRYMIGTPDFGRSDIWHSYFALKYTLSSALSRGYLPFWSKDVGTGVPLFADGQIGMLNLYNLLAFRLLPPVLAFNLGYLINFGLLFAGSYLYGKAIGLSKVASSFLGIVFSLSGFLVTQATHFSLLQSASYLPLEFFSLEKFIQTGKKRWIFVISILLSQQFYSGFPQMAMILVLTLFFYLLLSQKGSWKLSTVIWFFAGCSTAILISSPQILASWQLLRLSPLSGGASITELVKYPFNPKNFMSLFNPYFFGDPRIGTYPKFSESWGVFWESTGYIGVVPLLLLPLVWKFTKYQKRVGVFVVILVGSAVLVLGKYTPLFFLYQLPPLSMFRVPSRFLLTFTWALVVLAAIGLDRIRGRDLKLVVLLIASISSISFAGSYHGVIDSQRWLETPQVVKELSARDRGWHRVHSVIPGEKWNNIFLKSGWKNMESYYPYRNGLDPNQNVYWNVSSDSYYLALYTRRMELYKQLVEDNIKLDRGRNTYTVNDVARKLLSLSGVKYLTSSYPVDSKPGLISEIATISGKPIFYLYEIAGPKPHAYLTNNYVVAESISDLVTKVTATESAAVVLEETPEIAAKTDEWQEAKVVKNSDLVVNIMTDAKEPQLLILSDSYYPGWRATVDGTTSRIYRANINQRAVLVPAGVHRVIFKYDPWAIFKVLSFKSFDG